MSYEKTGKEVALDFDDSITNLDGRAKKAIRTDEFITLLTEKARMAQQPSDGAEPSDLAKRVKSVDVKIGRLMSAIEQIDMSGPLLQRVSELEIERED